MTLRSPGPVEDRTLPAVRLGEAPNKNVSPADRRGLAGADPGPDLVQGLFG